MSLDPAVEAQFQRRSSQYGMSVIQFESSWWGKNTVGDWCERVWAVVDEVSADAMHLAIACTGEPESTIQPYESKWHWDTWVPKSKAEIIVSPEWTHFEGEGTRRGTVYVALEKRDSYGMKVCLWGDTYQALAQDQHDALDGHWNQLHHTFDGTNWVIDEVNGIVVSKITDAGYDVKLAEGLDI